MKRFFKKFTFAVLAIALFTCAFFTVGCHKNPPQEPNPYATENNFAVSVSEEDGGTVYSPVGFTPTYGLVFYAGAFIDPETYSYIGNILAKQGYLTVIYASDPNFSNYDPNIPALLKYQNVKFFVGGHDIGGGTAVRHAMDYAKNNYNVAGLILFAPTNFKKQVFENGTLKYDGDGNPVWDHYSTAEYSIPALVIEVDDALRTPAMKAEAKAHVNEPSAQIFTLENSASTDFSVATADGAIKDNRTTALNKTKEFMLSKM